MMVRAYAALSAKATLEPFEYDPGPLGPHQVDVRVTHCGICHTDSAMVDYRKRLDDWLDSVPGGEREHRGRVTHRPRLAADDRLLATDQAEGPEHDRLVRDADDA